MRAAGRASAPDVEPTSPEQLERRALAYLNRYDSSAENLRRVLWRAVRRHGGDAPVDEAAAQRNIEALVARYLESGLLNDERFAEALSRGLRARGGSRRLLQQKLLQRGVQREAVERALQGEGSEQELEAARRLARRRRLGPYRPTPVDSPEQRRRDLAVLARAGFSFTVARAALALAPGDELEE